MLAPTFRKFVFGAIAVAMLPGLASAAAYSNGSQTSSFDVTMKIVADCTIAANGLDFGQTQGVLARTVTASSAINVTCTNTTPYNVGLNAGTGAGSSGTARYLSGTGANTNTVRFNLYQAPGATLWGNTQGTDTMAGTGSGALQTLTVYGEIPAQASPAPDSYKSTITATVYF
ncbi:spore coat U domain-containing protein [Massilia forsythiae]|uniref:Spore coat U domain-containing protein n=2 Tax=Massilia forsythiae TaxID=2728020 RepID=A0A7Z2ZTV1_9BURK|nr:spore coat U domain-containing protein [Massilia forsythiae]QJE01903.1 spore coat U domain-containing protein [Massilia forsythiae]